jgi:hypothetical protein
MLSRYALSVVSALFITLSVSGCGGGFNCPFQRPSCCDNVLFGCGPFDLPQGCSCGDFFSNSFRGKFAVKQGQLMRMSSATAAGKWRAKLTRKTSNCRSILSSLVSNVTISQSGSRVTMTAPGIATLRGTRTNNTINVTGQYTPMLMLGCDAQVASKMDLSANDRASVTGNVRITCRSRPSNNCSASYSGEAMKLK